MADVGEDLLDGDLDETVFNDLDAEEEDALLADDYESYQTTRQNVYAQSESTEDQSQMFHIVNQVQDVLEEDEIIEDAEPEDILELAVVDEFVDESEMDNGQTNNNQNWNERPTRTDDHVSNIGGGMSASLGLRVMDAESDEEENEGRDSRFKTERTTNVISLQGVARTSLDEIPDSLDKVATESSNSSNRMRGGRGGRQGVRGRLGPPPRPGGGMMQRGFGPMRRGGFGPNMRPPHGFPPHPHQHPPGHPPNRHPPPPGHKIHVNPHFRGGGPQPPGVWDNDRLPPPPGCEGFNPNMPPEGHWQNGPGYPPMMRPPFNPHHPAGPGPPPPGHPGHFHGPPQQNYLPHPPPQNYHESYPPAAEPAAPSPPRTVQFSENSQLVTVENTHYGRQAFDQNYPPQNQFPPNHPPQNGPPHPPHFNNYNNFQGPRPNAPPHQMPPPHQPPNYYEPQGYAPHQNGPYQQPYDNWNAPAPGPMNPQQNFYPPPQPTHQPPPPHTRPQPPRPNHFQNQQRPLPPKQQFQGKVSVMKRLSMDPPTSNASTPAKQMRFDHNKPKIAPLAAPKSNLLEIKTVDTLPSNVRTEVEPDVEEDEETRQYRLKIAEQKALREKILREKEARRLATIIEKQRQQDKTQPKPMAPKPVIAVPPSPQAPPQSARGGRGRGRGGQAMNRPVTKLTTQSSTPTAGAPVVQIQQMMGTVYKIVKVRTKEGAIVTKKTPLVINSGSNVITPLKTVTSNTNPSQRRVVLNNRPQLAPVKMVNQVMMKTAGVGVVRPGTNAPTFIPPRPPVGRTLSAIRASHASQLNKTGTGGQQRVVIDNRAGTMGVGQGAVKPQIPVSSLVTVENLSLSTTQLQIQKLAKQVGHLSSIKHEPDQKKATLKFQTAKEAEQFYLKFHRKMIDLSRINVTVVPE